MKKGKKLLVAGLTAVSLFTVIAIPVGAWAEQQNTNIQLVSNKIRPALIGNIRGSAGVRTRNANSNGIRVQTNVTSRDSNGNFLVSSNSGWHNRTAASGRTLISGTEIWTAQRMGTSRRGVITNNAGRRGTANGSWGGQLTASRTW